MPLHADAIVCAPQTRASQRRGADEGVLTKNSGWVGVGPPLQVGVGYTSRDYCDGQVAGALAHRVQTVPTFADLEEGHGEVHTVLRGTHDARTPRAMGKAESCLFDAAEVSALNGTIAELQEEEEEELDLGRQQGDREDVPIDFRFLGLLLRAAEDPEGGVGTVRARVGWGLGRGCHANQHFTAREELEAGIPDRPSSVSRGGGS